MEDRGMNGKFYAEAYQIDLNRAEKIGAFMNSFQSLPLLKDVRVWCKHGKARVYFEMNSQNSLGAFKPAFKFYYDANSNDVFADCGLRTWGLIPFERLKRFGNSYFSGAKTRKQIFQFIDDFYVFAKGFENA